MQDLDLLQTIAEIAIAIVGFTGVVAFLGQRARGEWRPVDLFRLNQLLAGGFSALLFAFLPILLFKLGAPEPAAWRISSGSIAIYIGAYVFLTARALRRIPEAERTEIVPAILMLILALIVAVFLLQLLSALGLVYAGSSAPVLVALVSLLAFSGFQFVRLLRMLGRRQAP